MLFWLLTCLGVSKKEIEFFVVNELFYASSHFSLLAAETVKLRAEVYVLPYKVVKFRNLIILGISNESNITVFSSLRTKARKKGTREEIVITLPRN